MARKKTTEILDELIERRDQLDEQIKKQEDKKRKEVRKADDKRRFLAGKLALEYRDKNPNDVFSIKLNELIAEHVTRPHDRALFELDPLPEQNTNGQSSQADDTQLAKPNATIPSGEVPNSSDNLLKEAATATK